MEPEKCPKCNGTDIMADVYDDDVLYFCPRCMIPVEEVMEDELVEECEWEESEGAEYTREYGEHKISSVGADKV